MHWDGCLFKLIRKGLSEVYASRKWGKTTHGKIVDSTINCVIEAKLEYISATFDIFCLMGNTSGIFVKEINIKAIFISNGPLPSKLLALSMVWEDTKSPSKLLGFFVGTWVGIELPSNIICSHLAKPLKLCLRKANMRHYNLLTRVCIAN